MNRSVCDLYMPGLMERGGWRGRGGWVGGARLELLPRNLCFSFTAFKALRPQGIPPLELRQSVEKTVETHGDQRTTNRAEKCGVRGVESGAAVGGAAGADAGAAAGLRPLSPTLSRCEEPRRPHRTEITEVPLRRHNMVTMVGVPDGGEGSHSTAAGASGGREKRRRK